MVHLPVRQALEDGRDAGQDVPQADAGVGADLEVVVVVYVTEVEFGAGGEVGEVVAFADEVEVGFGESVGEGLWGERVEGCGGGGGGFRFRRGGEVGRVKLGLLVVFCVGGGCAQAADGGQLEGELWH